MKRVLFIIICILTLCAVLTPGEAYAVRAAAKIVKYRQPDGSVISLVVRGDEFYGYTTTVSGEFVYQGPDRFFYKGSARINTCKSNGNVNGSQRGYTNFEHAGQPAYLREFALKSLFNGQFGQGRVYKQIRQFSHTIGHTVVEQPQSINSLVLLVEFSDVKFSLPNPLDYFSSMLNGDSFTENGATGSAASYLNDNFGGRCRFAFDLHGIITLDGSMEHYGGRTALLNDANPGEMVAQACLKAYEAGVDFSKYDSDGDGTVDNVAIIFAGYNEAESGESSAIWPHYGSILNNNVNVGGLTIGGYTCSSEFTGDNTASCAASIGTFIHEYCHSLGLPDMYDVNGQEEGLSDALYGSLSIMDRGNYLNGGHTPPYLTSIEREILGLGTIEDIEPGNAYSLPPVGKSAKVYRMKCVREGEYFLLECRSESGWDSYIGGSGLLVYHLDKSDTPVAGLPAAERWRFNIINSYAPHQCASVLAARAIGAEQGDISAIFYPGTAKVTSLDSQGEPGLVDWNGMGIGVSIKDIAYRQQRVTFKSVADIIYDEDLPYVSSSSVEPYHNGAFVKWRVAGTYDASSEEVEGNWNISVEDPYTGKILHEGISTQLYAAVGALEPETDYKLDIFYRAGLSEGKRYSTTLTTLPVESVFPYMIIKGNYSVGDVIHLNLQNMDWHDAGTVVKINGKVWADQYYTFEEPGAYLIEMSILLPDGSLEIICKHIKVN